MNEGSRRAHSVDQKKRERLDIQVFNGVRSEMFYYEITGLFDSRVTRAVIVKMRKYNFNERII